MKAIKVKLENNAYNYYEDEVLVQEGLKVHAVKKDENGTMTVGDIMLPKNNPTGKRAISTTRFKDGVTEVNVSELPVKTFGPRNPDAPKTQKVKINLDEYLTDEEKAKIEKHEKAIADIKAKAHERAQKDIKMAELKAQLMTLPEDVRNAMIAMMTGAEA